MPFAINFRHPGPNSPSGKLIIDRNNIIFVFAKNQGNEHLNQLSYEMRDALTQYINNFNICYIEKIHGHESNSIEHRINEHLGPADKDTYHSHLIFNNDVDYNLIKKLMNEFDSHSKQDDAINYIISPQARSYILSTVEKYFQELNSSAEAKQCEEDYRQEKNKQFKREKAWAVKDAKKAEEEKASKPTDAEDETDSFFASLTKFMMTTLMADKITSIIDDLSLAVAAPDASKTQKVEAKPKSVNSETGLDALIGNALRNKIKKEANVVATAQTAKKPEKLTGFYAAFANSMKKKNQENKKVVTSNSDSNTNKKSPTNK